MASYGWPHWFAIGITTYQGRDTRLRDGLNMEEQAAHPFNDEQRSYVAAEQAWAKLESCAWWIDSTSEQRSADFDRTVTCSDKYGRYLNRTSLFPIAQEHHYDLARAIWLTVLATLGAGLVGMLVVVWTPARRHESDAIEGATPDESAAAATV